MSRRHLLLLLPALAGLLLSLALHRLDRSNLTLVIEMELSWLAAAAGILLSLLLLFWQAAKSHGRRAAAVALRRQATEERYRFLQRLDHELKNPLTAIMAGLANAGVAVADPEGRDALESVATQVQRLRHLVSDLRKLADLERQPLERVPVDMTLLLEEIFELAEEHPGAAGRTLNLVIPRAPWPLPGVHGDRDLLFLAVYNCLDNALKFTCPGDRIELRAAEADGGLLIEVADTGPGIPAEELDQIWGELYRGAGARGVPGSGLGLALVRAVVSRHGGQTFVRSRPGQGTLVGLQLPGP